LKLNKEATQRILVIIPTFNEIQNIEPILERVLAVDSRIEVLVVDDNSPDGTGEKAKKMALVNPRISIMHRELKGGLGSAYIDGLTFGLVANFEVLIQMDADGSHPPEIIPQLLAHVSSPSGSFDLAIGSRWIKGGGSKDMPLSRQLLSRAANFYTRTLLGLEVKDTTSGFKAIKATSIDTKALGEFRANGYCFQIELLKTLASQGSRIIEVPITFTNRKTGSSKMNPYIVIEALVMVFGWWVQRAVGTLLAPAGRRGK
jgi:dolichol-phosphate mannosyltransferase